MYKNILILFLFLLTCSSVSAATKIINDQSGFDQGVYNQTSYNATDNAVLISKPNTQGSYISEVFDFGRKYKVSDISYSGFGNIDMTDLLFLAHHENYNGTTSSDSSDNGYDLTCNGNECPNSTTGKFGDALIFDGSDYIENIMPTSYDGDIFTVGGWIYATGGNFSKVSGYTDSNGYRKEVYLSTNNKIRVFTGNKWYETTSIVSNARNNWHHIVATFDGSNKPKVYVDNNEMSLNNGTSTGNITQPNTISLGTIGTRWNNGIPMNNSYYLKGKLDETFIFKRSLSSNEISKIYLNGLMNDKISAGYRICSNTTCSGVPFTNISNQRLVGENFSTTKIINPNLERYFQFKIDLSDSSEYITDGFGLKQVSFEYDLAPITPTAAPDMTTATDGGMSSSDNITKDTTPDFTVKCTEIGSNIKIYSDKPSANTVIGQGSCTSIGDMVITVNTLPQGTYNIHYTETDTANNESEKSPVLPIIIETTRPVITFDDDILEGPVPSDAFSISVTDANPDTSTYKYGYVPTIADCAAASAGNLTIPFTTGQNFDLLDETHNGKYVCATATDLAGNPNYQSSANPVNIDITDPTITITAPTKSSKSDITDTKILITDNNKITPADITITGGTFTCTQDNTTGVITCTGTIDTSGDIVVTATDVAGNDHQVSETGYIVDKVFPDVTFDTSIEQRVTHTNQTNYTISGTCTQSDGDVTIVIDANTTVAAACGTNGTFTTTVDLSALPDGETQITATQTDSVTNSTTTTGIITKDLGTPTLISKDTTIVKDTTLDLLSLITTAEDAIDGDLTSSVVVTDDGGFDSASIGNYTISYAVTDTAGNTATTISRVKVVFTLSSGTSSSDGTIYHSTPLHSDDSNEATPSEETTSETNDAPVTESNESENDEDKQVIEITHDNGVDYIIQNDFDHCPIVRNIQNDTNGDEVVYPLTDMQTYQYRDLIERFMSLGVIHGYDDNTFKPTKEISRGEFTKIALIAHCYIYRELDGVTEFTDMQEGTWQSKVAEKAKTLGIINGYGDGTFRFNDTISRAEATKILMRISLIELKKDADITYSDITTDWHKKYIAIGEALEILNAQSESYTFNPDSGVTRMDLVLFLEKLIKLYK